MKLLALTALAALAVATPVSHHKAAAAAAQKSLDAQIAHIAAVAHAKSHAIKSKSAVAHFLKHEAKEAKQAVIQHAEKHHESVHAALDAADKSIKHVKELAHKEAHKALHAHLSHIHVATPSNEKAPLYHPDAAAAHHKDQAHTKYHPDAPHGHHDAAHTKSHHYSPDAPHGHESIVHHIEHLAHHAEAEAEHLSHTAHSDLHHLSHETHHDIMASHAIHKDVSAQDKAASDAYHVVAVADTALDKLQKLSKSANLKSVEARLSSQVHAAEHKLKIDEAAAKIAEHHAIKKAEIVSHKDSAGSAVAPTLGAAVVSLAVLAAQW